MYDPFEKPMKVYVEIWEDLSVATELAEPKTVGAAIDQIVAYVHSRCRPLAA